MPFHGEEKLKTFLKWLMMTLLAMKKRNVQNDFTNVPIQEQF